MHDDEWRTTLTPGRKPVKDLKYCFAWDNDNREVTRGKRYYEFEAISCDAVKRVVMDMVMKDEEEYRQRVFSGYRCAVEARQTAIRQERLRQERAEADRQRAIAELLADREHLMDKAVADMAHADRIRELIAAMREKAQRRPEGVEGFEHWVGWATHHANVTDPRYMSVKGFEAWIRKFRLHE